MENLQRTSNHTVIGLPQKMEQNARMQGAIIGAALLGLETVKKYMPITPIIAPTRQQDSLEKMILIELDEALKEKEMQIDILKTSILEIHEMKSDITNRERIRQAETTS